jgi:hypothetical protein
MIELTRVKQTDRQELQEVAVVIPVPSDPPWEIFDTIPNEVAIIVVDDSDGRLGAPLKRPNVRFFDYASQERVMGRNYAAITHKSAAARNFGHFLAHREGFKTIIALDYDCATPKGWAESHVASLGIRTDAQALRADWINTLANPGLYARGFPYEYRNAEASAVTETKASGEVMLNIGIWRSVLDMNGIDKVGKDVPTEPEIRAGANRIALGNIPVCGMNTAFRAELTPAFFFLPDVLFEGWQLSRHDDIWGGYIAKRLMDVRGDLVSFGRPVVEHMRQTRLERVLVMEHYMHLMAMQFYSLVEEAVVGLRPGPYSDLFGAFSDNFVSAVDCATLPAHYRQVFRELGAAMHRWVRCFR